MIPTRYGVYFVATDDLTLVKIGKARNVASRIRLLRLMNAVPLVYLADVRGYTQVEAHLHRHFRLLRDHGEWFRYEQPIRDFVNMAAGDWKFSETWCAEAWRSDAWHEAHRRPTHARGYR